MDTTQFVCVCFCQYLHLFCVAVRVMRGLSMRRRREICFDVGDGFLEEKEEFRKLINVEFNSF